MTAAALPGDSLAYALCQSASAVKQVAAGHSLSALRNEPDGSADAQLRGASLDLTYNTLRAYGWVQALVRELSHTTQPEAGIAALLYCALVALESGRYADYAVVDQAVDACAALGRARAKGFVNGLLRRFLRERLALLARVERLPSARYRHPDWWIREVRTAYPAHWQRILEAGNARGPMCLRVNRRRSDLPTMLEHLRAADLPARVVGPDALLLERAVPVERVPGFAEGWVSVQDLAAQQAAYLLDVQDGLRVLDACAAPGGKTGHLLECADVSLTALDIDPERCKRIRSNLVRLGLGATVTAADATETASWWDGEPFDRVLLDAPCSASGVVRRHPDLKWLRRMGDLEQFAGRQAMLLASLWRVLRPGGKLLYVTCSVFPRENDAVIDAFADQAVDAYREALPENAPAQLQPDAEHDGFFHALLVKRA